MSMDKMKVVELLRCAMINCDNVIRQAQPFTVPLVEIVKAQVAEALIEMEKPATPDAKKEMVPADPASVIALAIRLALIGKADLLAKLVNELKAVPIVATEEERRQAMSALDAEIVYHEERETGHVNRLKIARAIVGSEILPVVDFDTIRSMAKEVVDLLRPKVRTGDALSPDGRVGDEYFIVEQIIQRHLAERKS